ncbi:MAG: TauD/TfdA family dioxygenase [Myxococcales bacterium]|nr:TauD/TfdA family dioxygenase [Myxococcales bacterium]
MSIVQIVELRPQDLAATAKDVLSAWQGGLVVVIKAPRGEALADVRAVYDALLPRLGTPHFLAEDSRVGDRSAQRTGELWMEVRYDPTIPDAYRHSPNAQPLHTDGSYIPSFPNATLMCCIANAGQGGETTFIGAPALVEVLAAEAPGLLARLERTLMPHARSGDARTVPVIRREAGTILMNWNYYCVAGDVAPEVAALRQEFFDFLRDSPGVAAATTAVKLAPGDAVVWHDDRLLHGRNAFVAHAVAERFLWKCAVDVGVFA